MSVQVLELIYCCCYYYCCHFPYGGADPRDSDRSSEESWLLLLDGDCEAKESAREFI